MPENSVTFSGVPVIISSTPAPNALPSSYRIHNGVLPNGALKLLPYNNDPYCILHCIYNRKHEASTTKALTSDKDYMKIVSLAKEVL